MIKGYDLSVSKVIFMQALISTREREILTHISYGLTTQDIAKDLYISAHTVISHRKNLMIKMGVSNTAGLVRKGFELGFLHARTLVG